MKKEVNKPPAFWDTSGIIPLCCNQPQSAKARKAITSHSYIVVWWSTPVEAISGFNRLLRQRILSRDDVKESENTLEYLRVRWNEVLPSQQIRVEAERLLRIHPLRAADAMQLAAAILWCDKQPKGFSFVCADHNLSKAADAEGFTVVDLN